MSVDQAHSARHVIPPAGRHGLRLEAGQVVRIVDLEGQQVVHLTAFTTEEAPEHYDAHTTRVMEKRWMVSVGNSLWSSRAHRMLTITSDSMSNGHFTGGGYCSSWINISRFGDAGTGNCEDNLRNAFRDFGHDPCHVPGAFAPFMNYLWFDDGTTRLDPPRSRAGDHVELRADMPLLLAISNCPQDRNACNGERLTPVVLEVRDAR